ncbi:hypothetical protein cypCar_00037104, partial [Cyprinus carpio]
MELSTHALCNSATHAVLYVLNTLTGHGYVNAIEITGTGFSPRQVCLFWSFLTISFFLHQEDPFPPSLVDLVMNSPISSVDDLKRLLDVESVEEDDEKPENEVHFNGTHRRLPRSLNVQVAQQAMCKVRTEVMEVTRSMLDKRNANFLLWPPCVEVQRCSGCCNTRILQCTPVTTETRHLQKLENITTTNQKRVIKISRKGNSSKRKHNIIFATNTTDTISFTNIQHKRLANNRLAHKEQ